MTERFPVRIRTRVLVVALAALVIVGVVVWLVVRASGGNQTAERATAAVIPLPGHQVCADQVRISVPTDAQMTRIAGAVRGDPRVRAVYTETEAQAFQRYQQEFADQPDLLAIGRPEALPATALVVPVGGVDAHQLADEYRRRFPEARQVEPMTHADSARALASIGETAPPVPCPASGEFPSH